MENDDTSNTTASQMPVPIPAWSDFLPGSATTVAGTACVLAFWTKLKDDDVPAVQAALNGKVPLFDPTLHDDPDVAVEFLTTEPWITVRLSSGFDAPAEPLFTRAAGLIERFRFSVASIKARPQDDFGMLTTAVTATGNLALSYHRRLAVQDAALGLRALYRRRQAYDAMIEHLLAEGTDEARAVLAPYSLKRGEETVQIKKLEADLRRILPLYEHMAILDDVPAPDVDDMNKSVFTGPTSTPRPRTSVAATAQPLSPARISRNGYVRSMSYEFIKKDEAWTVQHKGNVVPIGPIVIQGSMGKPITDPGPDGKHIMANTRLMFLHVGNNPCIGDIARASGATGFLSKRSDDPQTTLTVSFLDHGATALIESKDGKMVMTAAGWGFAQSAECPLESHFVYLAPDVDLDTQITDHAKIKGESWSYTTRNGGGWYRVGAGLETFVKGNFMLYDPKTGEVLNQKISARTPLDLSTMIVMNDPALHCPLRHLFFLTGQIPTGVVTGGTNKTGNLCIRTSRGQQVMLIDGELPQLPPSARRFGDNPFTNAPQALLKSLVREPDMPCVL